jgi:hypothetical protein
MKDRVPKINKIANNKVDDLAIIWLPLVDELRNLTIETSNKSLPGSYRLMAVIGTSQERSYMSQCP